MERRFLMPDLYFKLPNKETYKRFALAFIETNYPGWKPVKFQGRYLICRWEDN